MSKRYTKLNPTNITNAKTYFLTLKTNISLLKTKSIDQIYNKYIEYTKSENLKNDEKQLLINVINSIDWENDINKKTIEKIENIIKDYENKVIDHKRIYFEGSKYEVKTKTYKLDNGIKYELIFDSNIKETIYNIFTKTKIYLGINTMFISKVIIRYKDNIIEVKPEGELTYELIDEKLNVYPDFKTKNSIVKYHSYHISEIKKLYKKNITPDIIDHNYVFISYYKKQSSVELKDGNITIEIYENNNIENVLHKDDN